MSEYVDLASQQEARDAVETAHRAWLALAKFDQATVDRICEAMSRAALAEAERLGRMASEETGFGRPEDKREKNRFAAEDVWNHFKSLKTVGVVSDKGSVVEIASPRGVVAGIIPSTNPTSTAIFKILIAIKSRNAIVLSPHPSAVKCIAETARLMRDAGVREGLPPDAVQCLTRSALEGTDALMKHKMTAVILATGGIGLVRAAYSSGKPAFGVGPGNVPVFVERSADIAKAVRDILSGTCFDNGTICASEQAVVADAPIAKALREEFTKQGARFLSAEEAVKVGAVLITPQRTLNAKIVGRSAEHIAQLAGVSVPSGTRCLIADCAGVGREFPWSFEKLSPTLAFFEVDGLGKGAARCLEILQFGGMGHTAGMHTGSRDAAIEFGEQMPASRVVINSPTTHGAIGFSTDLSPSMTLGCGSWGGNVTSDNVSPLHLLDIKRVAFETKPVGQSAASVRVSVGGAAPSGGPKGAQAKNVRREDIAAIVDRFIGKKSSAPPRQVPPTAHSIPSSPKEPVRTVIHQIDHGAAGHPVDFVSEDDVRRALDRGEKIYLKPKAIITPAARDIGESKGVFVYPK